MGPHLKAPIYFPMQPRPWLSFGCFSAEIWEMQTMESFLFSESSILCTDSLNFAPVRCADKRAGCAVWVVKGRCESKQVTAQVLEPLETDGPMNTHVNINNATWRSYINHTRSSQRAGIIRTGPLTLSPRTPQLIMGTNLHSDII